jgi:hypothetical protein
MKGIINIFCNIQANTNNHLGIESTYFSEKFNLYYIGNRNRLNKDNNMFLNYFEIKDINKFNTIFLQLSPKNFFPTIYPFNDTREKIKLLSNYKNRLIIICSDPKIKPFNPVLAFNERKNQTILTHKMDFSKLCFENNILNNWQNLIDNADYLFPGKNLNKFFNDTKYNNFVYFDYFKEIFKNKIATPKYKQQEKEFDIVYYGDRRGSYREKQLQKYMNNSISNLLIGYKTKKIESSFYKKMKHKELLQTLNKCKVSLILADKEHEDNVVTFRFYETLASNCLAAIPIEFDPNKELIQDKKLKNILYVKDNQDVLNLSKQYSKELIERQHKEYLRHVAI